MPAKRTKRRHTGRAGPLASATTATTMAATRTTSSSTTAMTKTASFLIFCLALLLPAASVVDAQTFGCAADLLNGDWSTGTSSGIVSSSKLAFDAATIGDNGNATITLTKTAGDGQLCTLFAIESSPDDPTKRFYLPVGRSYDGNDWERVAGRFAEKVSYDCSAGGSCDVTLPDAGPDPDDIQYFMAAYKHVPTDRQKWSRFMEKASFGPKPDDVVSGEVTAMAAYVSAQQDLTPTSHREYFRKRLNPRSLEVYKYGNAGPHPCDFNSRWRNFAFTRKDKVMSTGPFSLEWPMDQYHNATLEARTVGAVTKFAWLYDGHVRTILTDRPQWTAPSTYAEGGEIPDGSYDVCAVDEARGDLFSTEKEKTLYAQFKLQDPQDNNACKHVYGGNPTVSIEDTFMVTAFDAIEPHILTGIASFSVGVGYNPASSESGVGYGWPRVNKVTDTVLLMTDANYRSNNEATCTNLPDPTKSDARSIGWYYSPYYVGRTQPNWSPESRSYLDPPVYTLTGSGWRIHDRRYTALENTIDNPLEDGGGAQTLASVFRDINKKDNDGDGAKIEIGDHDENPRTTGNISGEEQAIFCSNNAPNIFNEESCKLSPSENACVREGGDQDTVSVVLMNQASIDALNVHIKKDENGSIVSLGKGLAAVSTGLTFSAANNVEPPCTMNKFSRWIKSNVDENDCNGLSTDTLETNTQAAFLHLFKYAVTNNADYLDVTMFEAKSGMECDAADMDKVEVAVWDSSTSICYLNVHPAEGSVFLIKDSDMFDEINSNSGVKDWNKGMLAYESFISDTTKYEYWGRVGDYKKLKSIMISLDIYTEMGGKAVTSAPTGKPSVSPTDIPSMSIVPTTTKAPMSDRPSASFMPSSSSMPSDSPSISDAPSTSENPSTYPTINIKPSSSSSPSSRPSASQMPSGLPSSQPSSIPSMLPSEVPSVSLKPSSGPSNVPSAIPTDLGDPSSHPSANPSQLSEIIRTESDNIIADIADDPAVTQVILETQNTDKKGGVLVCGSSGEIKPDPIEDDYFDYWNWRLDSSKPESEQKKTVWTNIVYEAPDQLCQRTAWALSQIFQISPAFLAYNSLSEAHINFYDGFVRNCNASYKQVMKTVAFSIKMGMQLSHVGSASVRLAYDRSNQVRFPDENYAREAMQLETVGLDMLNLDGTKIRNTVTRLPVPTYDTNDILTFARAWTGFEIAPRRGNYEEKDPNTVNWNDPMVLKDGQRHDWFPKKDLLDGWIGDRYPLCSDLPPKAFLKRGAVYKLLGRSSQPRYQYNKGRWDGNEKAKKLTLDNSNSNLYNELKCLGSGSGCTYQSVITITADVTCYDLECDLDTVRVVQVEPNVFYEYVQRPCVHHAFIDNAKTVFAGGASGASMCADPSRPIATNTCCPNSGGGEIRCKYHGEYVSYDTNTNRCDVPNDVCSSRTSIQDTSCTGQVSHSNGSPGSNHFQWTSGSCTIKIKVRIDAMIALVHIPDDLDAANNVVRYVSNSIGNMNYFHVPWPKDNFLGDELFPNYDNNCGEGTCTPQDDWTCLCDVAVTTSVAFVSNPSSIEDILSTLKVGAFPPEHLGGYQSTSVVLSTGETITVYHKNSDYAEDTIFKITDETDEFIDFGTEYHNPDDPTAGVVYLKNVVSEIEIGDSSNTYFIPPGRKPLKMSNPLMFHDLVLPEIRDAHYEIDAVIHHLTSHPNAAPFIGLQLIQHFGIANPSPGMIERVATAYNKGTFSSHSNAYGDGRYSSLKAVVAAILLDQEATASTLDADPAYGGIKEPIIKVLQFMRAMKYKQNPFDRNIYPKLSGMVSKIGQMAYESPDQFSFFLPDYSPPGQFAQGGLFAPPAQVLTMSTTVATIEGFFNFVRHGLSGHNGGFGSNIFENQVVGTAGVFSQSVGYLSFSPSGTDQQKVQEIADLLTAGRLSPAAVTRIVDGLDGSDENKVRLAQQLIATAPEFHTTNLADRTGNKRTPSVVGEPENIPYKAIVILLASGGLDSFNVLSPHSSCDLFRSYRQNRGILALSDKEMLQIANDNEDQPCTTFGVNNLIPAFKNIFDAGKGQFHANIGHLSKPVTKSNWYTETQTHLFSHKTMEREAQLVDAFQEDGWSTGVAGRMLDVLQRRGLSVNAIGVDGKDFILEGNPALGRTVDVFSSGGVNTLQRLSLTDNSDDLTSLEPLMEYLNEETNLETSGVFSNFFSQNLVDVLNKTENLDELLNGHFSLTQRFDSSVGRKLKVITKLMLLNNERKVNRDVFLIKSGGHDAHSLAKDNLRGILPDINSGIQDFYNEMDNKNMLNNVTFVFISEFGRTLTPNTGEGSDHAWGGNAFVWGGQILGKKILGQYPLSFDNTEVQNIGRGRLIPKRSWESLWYGVANWFGITDETEMLTVLPNNGNMGCQLYTDSDMYIVGETTIRGCNDRTVTMKLGMLLNEPRYLTGLEQKRICQAAIGLTVQNANTTSRCVVTDQKVTVYFEEGRRVLSDGEIDARVLAAGDIANITLEGTVAYDYQNPPGSEDGTLYVENSETFATDMNDQLASGSALCSQTRRRRMLAGNSRHRMLAGGGSCLDICGAVTEMAAQVTSQPSSQPSSTPSSAPSSQPSSVPSSQPSSTPSSAPSSQPSSTPSSAPSLQPSNTPSSAPSLQPSSVPSLKPSSTPSSAPSLQPSSVPSIQPSNTPSSAPSLQPSSVPSIQPSSTPSSAPSLQPSSIPSSQPSNTPSSAPSIQPSLVPTVPAPSSKPSVAPSSRPSKDCPVVFDECFNGGMWSPFTCQCLCVSPNCPNAEPGKCLETTCPANYHETFLDDQPDPWFKFGASCTASKALPPSVNAIYRTKEDCCQKEYPKNSGSCVERPAAVMQLAYTGKLVLVGIECSKNGSERASAVGTLARSILKIVCSKVTGLSCSDNSKVVVTKFCGLDFETEAQYSSGNRRLENTVAVNDDIVEFLFSSTSLDSGTLETIESLLSAYLQGATLTSFLSDVLQDVMASNPPPSLQSITSILYTAVAAFISGLGLFFPAWGRSETCLSDGGQEDYMNRNHGSWLYETLESCCQRYYGWDQLGCKLRNLEATLVSGAVPSVYDPTGDLYFPDWKGTDTCVNDGTAPPYMKKDPALWMYEDLAGCCRAYYGWEGGFVECMSSQGGDPPTRSPITEAWYANWENFVCVKSCDGTSPCGGVHHAWDILHPSKFQCCQEHLWWKDDCMTA